MTSANTERARYLGALVFGDRHEALGGVLTDADLFEHREPPAVA